MTPSGAILERPAVLSKPVRLPENDRETRVE